MTRWVAGSAVVLVLLTGCSSAEQKASAAETRAADHSNATRFGKALANRMEKRDALAQLGIDGVADAAATSCVDFAQAISKRPTRWKPMSDQCLDAFLAAYKG